MFSFLSPATEKFDFFNSSPLPPFTQIVPIHLTPFLFLPGKPFADSLIAAKPFLDGLGTAPLWENRFPSSFF